MSRPRRHCPGGMVFHVLNRGVGRKLLFTKDEDFLAFERVVEETLRTRRMRLCAYCLMPDDWDFVVWPERGGDLPAFMQQMTNTHVKRWKEHRHEIGYGHLYQGRYKCFPVATVDYFYQVVRYVERNALHANLVERAESWRWSSLRRVEREDPAFPILSTWPLPRPTDWLQLVNQPQTEAEVAALRSASIAVGPSAILTEAEVVALRSASIAVGPSAILTGSRTRPSDWGWNGRFGPVEGRRNNHRLVTVTCIIWILQIWWLSLFSLAISFTLRTSSIEDNLLRLPPPQPGTTGVLRVETFARTDLSMFRCAFTSSYGVNANHCASETSAKWSDCHSSRYRSVVVPVFSM